MDRQLAQKIQQLAADIPDEIVRQLADSISQTSVSDWKNLRHVTNKAVIQPLLKARVAEFIDYWQASASHISTESVALALITAALTWEHYRLQHRVDLVWTGPAAKGIALRRIDQALIQLIQETKYELHIVSFAVYKAHSIIEALLDAAKRGVNISIYLETPEGGPDKIAYNPLLSVGKTLTKKANIYYWPHEKRPRSEDGKYGSLHAKFAVADGKHLLISSANLTDYAMTLNIELGLLLYDEDISRSIQQQLVEFVQQGIFQAII